MVHCRLLFTLTLAIMLLSMIGGAMGHDGVAQLALPATVGGFPNMADGCTHIWGSGNTSTCDGIRRDDWYDYRSVGGTTKGIGGTQLNIVGVAKMDRYLPTSVAGVFVKHTFEVQHVPQLGNLRLLSEAAMEDAGFKIMTRTDGRRSWKVFERDKHDIPIIHPIAVGLNRWMEDGRNSPEEVQVTTTFIGTYELSYMICYPQC